MEILIAVLIIVVVWLGIDVITLKKQVKMWVAICKNQDERMDEKGSFYTYNFNNINNTIKELEAENQKLWGTIKLLTEDKPAKPVKKVTPEIPKFKKGQWILSKWNKEYRGQTDFAKFDRKIDDKNFADSAFYRFTKDEFEDLSDDEELCYYMDGRKSIQWRAATKAEIEKFTKLIAKKK